MYTHRIYAKDKMAFRSTPCPFRYYLLPAADGFQWMHLVLVDDRQRYTSQEIPSSLRGIYSLLSVIFRVFQFTGTVDGKNAPAAQANALTGHDGSPRKGRNEILANPT